MALQDLSLTPEMQFDLDVVMLKDDAEEDLVGSDLHQTAIRTLYEGLWLAGPERGLPWHVSTQLVTLMGKLGGKVWNPSPDIFVHPTAGAEPRTSFDTAREGVPPFVVEVASPATWNYDNGAKGRSYGYAGIQEYIVFDPTTELLGTPVQAWHATDDGFVPWSAGDDGRWHSAVLGVALEPMGPLLRVWDQESMLLPTFSEQTRQIVELRAQARRVTELEAELRKVRGGPAIP